MRPNDVGLIRVAPGTPATTCTGHNLPGGSCKARVYWVRDRYGNVPVDCEGDDAQRPSEFKDANQADLFSGTAVVHEGFGRNHAAECPDRALFAIRARERASA